MNKVVLSEFPDSYLECMEELLLTMEPEQIYSMIQEIKEKRKNVKKQHINAIIKVEEMGLDWTTVLKLKKQNINTLYDVMQLDIKKIPEITQSEIERLEWAILFFDMTELQQKSAKNHNISESEEVKMIVSQGQNAEKQIIKKYGRLV